jgi:hypothetical protein
MSKFWFIKRDLIDKLIFQNKTFSWSFRERGRCFVYKKETEGQGTYFKYKGTSYKLKFHFKILHP